MEHQWMIAMGIIGYVAIGMAVTKLWIRACEEGTEEDQKVRGETRKMLAGLVFLFWPGALAILVLSFIVRVVGALVEMVKLR